MDDLILHHHNKPEAGGEPLPTTALEDSSVKLLLPWMLCGMGGSEGSPPGEPEGRLPPGTLELTHLF